MPTSAWTRRSETTYPIAGPGGPSQPVRGRRWPWIAVAMGVLLAAGAVVATIGHDPNSGWQPDGHSGPLGTTAATLPFDIVAPVGSTAGSVQGQSAVSPPGRPGGPVTPASPSLFLEPETVRGAEVRLTVGKGDFGSVFDRAASVASTFGGFVASSTSSFDEEGSAGQLVLRVPVANLDPARRAVAALGEVESETLRGQDVSAQLVDQEARQRTLEAQEGALRTLVGKATTVGEVLQIQPALTSVRQQIEQLHGQRARLEDAAALSSILVTIREPGAPSVERTAEHRRTGLGRRFEQAVDGALAVAGGAIVVLGWATPALVLAGAGWLFVAVRRRRAA